MSGLPKGDLLAGQTISLNAALLGPDGKPIALQTGTLHAQASAELLGADNKALATIDLKSNPSDTTHYLGDLVAREPGQYTVKVHFTSLQDGKPILLAEQGSDVFSVRPVKLLTVRWDDPPAGSVTDTTVGIPPLVDNPWWVTIQALSEKDNTPLDLVPLTSAAAPFTVKITTAKGDAVTTQALTADTTKPGRYTVAVRGLAPGTYTLTLTSSSDPLNGDYLFDPAARTQTRAASLRTNPSVYAFYASMAGVGLVLLGSAAAAAVVAQRRRRHPLRGQIAIWYSPDDSPGQRDIVWQAAFGARRTNRYRVNANKLPRHMGLKRLTLECSSDDMAKRQGCPVTAELKTGIVKRVTLYPEDQQTLLVTDDGFTKSARIYRRVAGLHLGSYPA